MENQEFCHCFDESGVLVFVKQYLSKMKDDNRKFCVILLLYTIMIINYKRKDAVIPLNLWVGTYLNSQWDLNSFLISINMDLISLSQYGKQKRIVYNF